MLDIGERLVFRAGAWSRLAQLGLNAASGSSNRLAVGSPAVQFTHEGAAGSMRLKVNKSGTGETASQLFQTGFSGRAELGLMGDDKFRIKISSNGTA